MKRRYVRFISLLLAVLLLIGEGAVVANAASTISLPSPSEYFGTSPKIEKDDDVTVYTYSGYKTFPEAKVDEFVADMESEGLKLTMTRSWTDGDKIRRMELQDEAAVVLWWRDKTKSIEVRVHPCVSLTDSTDAVIFKNGKNVLPMPDDYFANFKDSFYDDEYHVYRYIYSYSSYPKTAVNKFKKALQAQGFDTSYETEYSDGDVMCIIKMDNISCVSFLYEAKSKELVVNLFDEKLDEAGYSFSGSSTTPITKPNTTPKPTATAKPTNHDGIIPDPGAFLGCVTLDDRASGDNAWQYSYKIKADDAGKKGVREFVELIQDSEYELELIDYQVLDYTSIERGYTYRFSFKYTGSKTFSTFKDYNDQNSHVMLLVSHIKDVWGISLSLYITKDMKDELLDTGERASERVTCLVSNGNIYDVKDNSSYNKQSVPCGVCDDGKCKKCGGDGYVYSSASKKEDRNCPAGCSRGRCTKCGGDGWLD